MTHTESCNILLAKSNIHVDLRIRQLHVIRHVVICSQCRAVHTSSTSTSTSTPSAAQEKMEDEVLTLVLDNGSHTIKAGLADFDDGPPRCV